MTAITFPRSLLSLPLQQVSASPGAQSPETWSSSAPAGDFPGSVRRVIGALVLVRAGHPDIRLIAEAVGIGARTLQRRLAEAGVSYTRLLVQARLEMAVHLLKDTRNKLTDIAHELGYSDHAHFSRAFRQWTGSAPRDFRRLRHTTQPAPGGVSRHARERVKAESRECASL